MNISASLRIAMIKHDKDLGWLAEQLGCSRQYASKIAKHGHASQDRIEKLAAMFGMKVSDFIALGED